MLSTNVLCIKKRKKRSYCITGGRSSSSSSEYAPTPDKNKRSVGGAAAMLHITEDTPPDMLAGAMDLTVHLPTGRSVKMSAERSTPMMDLLVQITNNNRLQLSEYTLQALGMEPSSERGDKVLPFKPNTPIGALDTQHIRVVPKSRTVPVPKNIPPGHQPFESTFRLKVHLPRNQLYVTRVSQSVHLEDIMKKVCEEKNLDPIKYEFRHPGNLDETLDPKLTLSDYKITEVCIVLKGTAGLNQTFTTNDIMALRKEEERKQMHNKTGGGVFNLIFRRGNKQSSGSLSSENRSISPTHSDDSRSVTPPAIQNQIVAPRPQQEPEAPAERPKPPQRKRRPAPKPPQVKAEDKVEAPTKIEDPKQEDTSGLTICHSRNSSDSSGYHEASILSDNCNTSLPRRPKSTVITEEAGDEFGSKMSGAYSQSASNLTKMSSHSKSTSSLAFPSRKKKSAPAPPPPVLKATNSVTTLDFNDKKPSPVVASQPLQTPQSSSSSLAQSAIIIESGHSTANESTPVTVASNDLNTPDQSPPVSETVEDRTREAEEVKEEVPPPVVPSEKVVQKKEDVGEHDLDWHYRLPSPPKAFRDSSPARFEDTVTTTYESADVTDSVVTSPELFEKLKVIKDNQDGISDLTSIVSEEDQNKPILSTLSLEHLEKRKSLVYNRELATSLKSAAPTPSPVNNSGLDVDDTVMRKTKNNAETFSSSVTTFEKTYEEMRRSSQQKESNNRNTLPNFKITTYDKPKPKLNIFEDDTIRSNEKNPSNGNNSRRQSEESKPMSDNNFAGRSVENVRRNSANVEEDVKKPAEYKFYRPNRPPTHNHKSQYVSVLRSESLSHKDLDNWSPSRPVTRSKSQVALNKYLEKNAPNADPEEENLSKGNSLFDLQSIGVMRLIQTKLNTPTSSMEGLNKIEGASYQRQPETKPKEVQREEPKPAYHYRPSPSINMGTWSDRPKIPVNVKDDPDYKFGKLIVTTSNNDVKSNNTVEVNRSNNFNVKVNNQDYNNRNVSIKVNGSEPISAQNTGNVVIKIGQKQTVNLRRPLGTLDKNEQRHHQIRPHSIAFGGESDDNQSRIPFVRSVELKKPFKDTKPTNNTSITPIFHNNNNNSYSTQTLNRNGNYSFGRINDYNNTSSHNNHNIEVTHQNNISNKPNFRVNSFVQNSAPVVRGFRSDSVSETNRWSHHQQPHSFASTTATNNNNNNIKEVGNKKFNTKIVTPVPFSQVTLRRTEFNSTSQPPPAPPPMKVAVNIKSPLGNNNFNNGPVDSKEQLLQAIRDFGGKKGLKAVKA